MPPYGHQLITPPAGLPVSVEEAKMHCRIDGSLEDEYIASLIQAAVKDVEHKTGRQLINATWRMTFDSLPAVVELYRAPVSSVTSVKYIDESGVEQTLDPADYIFDGSTAPARLCSAAGKSWPSASRQIGAASITYVAGYGTTADAVPASLRQAIKLLVAHWYEHREAVAHTAVNEVPLAVVALLATESITPA